MRTKYEPRKDNAAKTKANTQLAIANRTIHQSKEQPQISTQSVMCIQ